MLSKKLYTDQMGREVYIPVLPKRIVSIVPSQTELLFDLGLNENIVGITKFCIHPADAIQAKTTIGGTKELNIELINSLQPDLIIANKEENERSQVEHLAQHFPVWISDINNLDDALQMIRGIAEINGKALEAQKLIQHVSNSFKSLKPVINPLSVAYMIWRKPYMVAGKETYIDDMMGHCGLCNVINETRYPEVDAQQLITLNPDVILLSSEPYPFKPKHFDEVKAILPKAKVFLVDGEMFSWYGSRLQHAAKYFGQIIKMLDNQPGNKYL